MLFIAIQDRNFIGLMMRNVLFGRDVMTDDVNQNRVILILKEIDWKM